LLPFLFGVEALAIVLGIVAVAQTRPTATTLIRLGVLLALSIFFEESARRIEKTRTQLSERSGYTDMTSVWMIAAVLCLPAGAAILLVVLIRLHMWLRHHRYLLIPPYQLIFTAATMVIAVAVGERVMQLAGHHAHSLSGGPTTALVIGASLVVFTLLNRALVFGAIYIASGGKQAQNILGTWAENSIEIATLCLGALIGVAMFYQPWLIVLALPPMFALQRGALIRELEAAASTDAKTGLLNALAWQQVAKRELSRSERDAKPGAVLLIDLDHFKVVNDTHGHLIGDTVLRAVATAITAELRDYDAVGRFGGEEFVAILPDVDVPTAISIAERIRRRIAGLRLAQLDGAASTPSIGPDDSLTASIGLAHYPAHGTDLETLLHASDTALYVAKRSGRDRVVLADRGASGDQETADALR
jgi:diguanylate cyclase (GGDEF)-like protein